jgi:DNA-binding CsgD family transcriptional regulator
MERVGESLEWTQSQPSTASAYPAGLSERETEVLSLLGSGLSNAEIAAGLVLSIRTVERHISNIYGKTNSRGRADATAFAYVHGLIPSD